MASIQARTHAPDRSPIPIRNFGKERYVSPAWTEREFATLWATSWLVAGVACDVRSPGQLITFDIGDQSVIVARGGEPRVVDRAAFTLPSGPSTANGKSSLERPLVSPARPHPNNGKGLLPGTTRRFT